MAKYCFALDLKDDPQLIAAYEQHHKAVWPAVLESMQSSGVQVLEIYRAGNRLFMIMETAAGFSFEKKAAADAASQEVQAWENLMWTYQQALPFAAAGQKWVLMEKIFHL
ncbi:MAG: L-rhamnose mutarotase [Sphingobacteriales bacterium]|nr:MAG: L-rhamnose mutarotase [Sphingobacteriales bacterium]